MVLYHAISSYQLLEVMLHRWFFHRNEKTVLLLPDFITEKYPQYRLLTEQGFFEEVYLFPYTRIPHKDEETVTALAVQAYDAEVPWKLENFRRIYIAGAHFYFSLLPIKKKCSFIFLEDAAGMLSHPQKLKRNLQKHYPLHSALADKYGLFDGSNPYISAILCLKKAQTIKTVPRPCLNFSVEDALLKLPVLLRRKFVRFFLKRRIWTRADTILLTQNFAGLGEMTRKEQIWLYQNLAKELPAQCRLLIKRHPDDQMDYQMIFPGAKVIRETFPSELLPYVFWKKPGKIYTITSTGCENLGKHFELAVTGNWILPKAYDPAGRKDYV